MNDKEWERSIDEYWKAHPEKHMNSVNSDHIQVVPVIKLIFASWI